MIKYITVPTFSRLSLSFCEVAISLEEITSVLTCFSGGKLLRLRAASKNIKHFETIFSSLSRRMFYK